MSALRPLLSLAVLGLVCGPGLAAAPDSGLELRTAALHPVRYFLSLPKGYAKQPGKKWPVLVVLTGAGHGYESLAADYVTARGDLPVIVAVPVTFNNNFFEGDDARPGYLKFYDEATIPPEMDMREWDEAAFRAVLIDLQNNYDAEPRAYLSFFSAGGFVGYDLVVTHAEMLAGVGAVGANFMYLDYRQRSHPYPPEVRALPIRLFLGADDSFRHIKKVKTKTRVKFALAGAALAVCMGLALGLGLKARRLAWSVGLGILVVTLTAAAAVPKGDWGLEIQVHDAEAVLRELGYTNIQQTIVSGMDHEPRPALVIDAFKGYWK